MTISAKIVADSVYAGGPRLTTFVLKYPRFVHSEFMTHRVFSRNAASSRAIPVQKMIDAVLNDPAMPTYWGKNQAGMQAKEELPDFDKLIAKLTWLDARNEAVRQANKLLQQGLHKQIANRILEPWMHIEVVCTATDWANFYALRNHPDAQPEMQELARVMLEAHRSSTPNLLVSGQWHLPYITTAEYELHFPNLALSQSPASYDWLLPKISTARCARVSYLKHDGTNSTIEEDLNLYERLMGGNPKHASPTEHQAMVPDGGVDPCYQSNLQGWIQFRKRIGGERIQKYEEFHE